MEPLLHAENETLLFTDTETKPFTYVISAKVSSVYDDFQPVAMHNMMLNVDPTSKAPDVSHIIDVDNHHSRCRHFRGHLHAKYSRAYEISSGEKVQAKIEFSCWWDRTCGSTGWSNIVTFAGDVKEGKAQLDYIETVRVNIEFKVK